VSTASSSPPGRPRLRALAALATGALLVAAMPPYGLPELAWPAFVPLLLAVRGLAWRPALRLGLLAGFALGLGTFAFLIDTLIVFAELPLLATLPVLALYALWTAVPLGLWTALLSLGPAPRRPLTLALAFVGVWWTWPVLFPFTPVLGLAGRPLWIQSAELGGDVLVTLLVLVFSALLADAIATRSRRSLLLALALLAATGLLGAARIASLEPPTRTVRVGLVQPNIPLLWDDKQARLARLRGPSAAAQAAGARLVVWPENIYPWPLDRPFSRDFSDADRLLAEHDLPTIFGAGNIADLDDYGYNSAFLMAKGGQVLARYDKILLVPLGERIPLVDPEWAKSQMVGMAHNFAGTAPERFVLADPAIVLGPLICYEDVFPALARAVAGQPGGVEAFVNLTNDTWFGATAEPARHLALAQFRSVEHRIPTLRSVNSGPSSLVDHAGRVVATTDLRPASPDTPPEFLVVDVPLGRTTESAPTLFARGGWLLVHACQLFAAGLLLAALRRRR
jgi:apolipoprotein N-acyltransferase